MDLATLVPLGLKASIATLVFGLGLSAAFDDVLYLFRWPALLARSLLALNIVMPLFAVAMAKLFDLHPAVEIALVALAVSPVPPMLPRKQQQAGGHASYSVGLLVTVGLFAIVYVPAAMELLGSLFGTSAHMPFMSIARLVLMTIFGSLLAGMIFRAVAPALAVRIVKPMSLIATVLLFACSAAILFSAGPAIWLLIGNGTIVAIAAFIIVGLVAGHLLGGPGADERSVLALASAAHHPGIALAIAHTNFPQQELAPAAILLYLIISAILSIPYVMWRKRHAEINDKIEIANQ
jgi:BASS family bile acid:Na+ symporter